MTCDYYVAVEADGLSSASIRLEFAITVSCMLESISYAWFFHTRHSSITCFASANSCFACFSAASSSSKRLRTRDIAMSGCCSCLMCGQEPAEREKRRPNRGPEEVLRKSRRVIPTKGRVQANAKLRHTIQPSLSAGCCQPTCYPRQRKGRPSFGVSIVRISMHAAVRSNTAIATVAPNYRKRRVRQIT